MHDIVFIQYTYEYNHILARIFVYYINNMASFCVSLPVWPISTRFTARKAFRCFADRVILNVQARSEIVERISRRQEERLERTMS
jgi:hypothetical protein